MVAHMKIYDSNTGQLVISEDVVDDRRYLQLLHLRPNATIRIYEGNEISVREMRDDQLQSYSHVFFMVVDEDKHRDNIYTVYKTIESAVDHVGRIDIEQAVRYGREADEIRRYSMVDEPNPVLEKNRQLYRVEDDAQGSYLISVIEILVPGGSNS